MLTSEPVPGKLYVWKWGKRGLYQTKDLRPDTSRVRHSLKHGDVFLLLEHSVNLTENFWDIVFKIIAGKPVGGFCTIDSTAADRTRGTSWKSTLNQVVSNVTSGVP